MKKSKEKCDLNSCFLCTSCLKEWLPAIDARREMFHYKKGEVILREGDLVSGIYFIYHGKVKVHKHWGSEKELIVRFAKKGDILGHRGWGKDKVYPISATALEPVTLCYIDLSFFQTTLKVNNELTFQLLQFYAAELQESEQKMRNLAHMSVKGRMAYCLLKLKDIFGVNEEGFIDVPLSRQDIASYAGTAYETAFRIMNEFVENGLIRMSGKNISILKPEVLGVTM